MVTAKHNNTGPAGALYRLFFKRGRFQNDAETKKERVMERIIMNDCMRAEGDNGFILSNPTHFAGRIAVRVRMIDNKWILENGFCYGVLTSDKMDTLTPMKR
jgi:hypothetical protein